MFTVSLNFVYLWTSLFQNHRLKVFYSSNFRDFFSYLVQNFKVRATEIWQNKAHIRNNNIQCMMAIHNAHAQISPSNICLFAYGEAHFLRSSTYDRNFTIRTLGRNFGKIVTQLFSKEVRINQRRCVERWQSWWPPPSLSNC